MQRGDRETRSRERVANLVSTFAKKREIQTTGHVTPAIHPAQLRSFQREPTPFVIVYPVLLKRSYLGFKRRPNVVVTKIMQVTSAGITLALFYSRLGNDYAAIQNRVGYIQQLTPIVFIGLLVLLSVSVLTKNNIAVYPDERNIFYREHEDGAYEVEPFFLTYFTFEILLECIMATIGTLFLLITGFPSIQFIVHFY